MARQRIHNRRAARGSVGGGASWISYSDMMAALLLIFVLILAYSLYQYFTMLETKTRELNLKERALIILQTTLDSKEEELNETNIILISKEAELEAQNLILIEAEKKLDELELQLSAQRQQLEEQQRKLDEQRQAMDDQTRRIEELVGIRTHMIEDLSASLAAANLKATVDKDGNIVLDSSVFFEYGKYTIRPEGQELLNRFIPVYLEVLLRDEYADYLGEIIIEGHTDSSGDYETNLELSQDRALAVAKYCLNMSSLTVAQKAKLKQILTAKGRSDSDLVYDDYGREDAQASRRVEFKFSLKDADMINEMNRILSEQERED